jgi:NitT/TauT family transport system substrate-binding protein
MQGPHLAGALAALALLLGACTAPGAPAAAPPAGERPDAAPTAGGAAASQTAPPAPMRARFSFSSISGIGLPYWTAVEGGLFTRQGVELELGYSVATAAMGSLIAGDVDLLASAGPELVAANVEGADVVGVAGTLNKVVQALMAAPGLGEPSALRGHQIGVTRYGSLSDFSARYLLRNWGLQPETDVAILQIGGIPEILAAFAGGGLDAGVLTPPFTLQAGDLGFVELANLWSQPLEYPGSILTMRRPTRPEQEELVRRFVRGLAEGVHLMLTDRDLAVRALAAGTQTNDARALNATYDIYTPLFERDLRLSREALRTVIDQLAAANPRAAGIEVERLIDPRFVDELKASGFVERLYAR